MQIWKNRQLFKHDPNSVGEASPSVYIVTVKASIVFQANIFINVNVIIKVQYV